MAYAPAPATAAAAAERVSCHAYNLAELFELLRDGTAVCDYMHDFEGEDKHYKLLLAILCGAAIGQVSEDNSLEIIKERTLRACYDSIPLPPSSSRIVILARCTDPTKNWGSYGPKILTNWKTVAGVYGVHPKPRPLYPPFLHDQIQSHCLRYTPDRIKAMFQKYLAVTGTREKYERLFDVVQLCDIALRLIDFNRYSREPKPTFLKFMEKHHDFVCECLFEYFEQISEPGQTALFINLVKRLYTQYDGFMPQDCETDRCNKLSSTILRCLSSELALERLKAGEYLDLLKLACRALVKHHPGRLLLLDDVVRDNLITACERANRLNSEDHTDAIINIWYQISQMFCLDADTYQALADSFLVQLNEKANVCALVYKSPILSDSGGIGRNINPFSEYVLSLLSICQESPAAQGAINGLIGTLAAGDVYQRIFSRGLTLMGYGRSSREDNRISLTQALSTELPGRVTASFQLSYSMMLASIAAHEFDPECAQIGSVCYQNESLRVVLCHTDFMEVLFDEVCKAYTEIDTTVPNLSGILEQLLILAVALRFQTRPSYSCRQAADSSIAQLTAAVKSFQNSINEPLQASHDHPLIQLKITLIWMLMRQINRHANLTNESTRNLAQYDWCLEKIAHVWLSDAPEELVNCFSEEDYFRKDRLTEGSIRILHELDLIPESIQVRDGGTFRFDRIVRVESATTEAAPSDTKAPAQSAPDADYLAYESDGDESVDADKAAEEAQKSNPGCAKKGCYTLYDDNPAQASAPTAEAVAASAAGAGALTPPAADATDASKSGMGSGGGALLQTERSLGSLLTMRLPAWVTALFARIKAGTTFKTLSEGNPFPRPKPTSPESVPVVTPDDDSTTETLGGAGVTVTGMRAPESRERTRSDDNAAELMRLRAQVADLEATVEALRAEKAEMQRRLDGVAAPEAEAVVMPFSDAMAGLQGGNLRVVEDFKEAYLALLR